MTETLERRLRETLHFEADRLPPEEMVRKPSTVSRRRLLQLPRWLAAPAAALLVLLIAGPAIWFASRSDQSDPAASYKPLDVGVDYVWPDGGFRGTADQLAAEFARQALGWADVEVESDLDNNELQQYWTTVRNSDGREIRLLSEAFNFDFERRALIQVGPVGATVEPVDGSEVQRVMVRTVAGAVSAAVHVRYVESDRVEVVTAGMSDLDRGWVEVASPDPIAGVIIVYFDESGLGVSAETGTFGPYGDAIEFGRDGLGLSLSPAVYLAMPSRHGDASVDQLELLAAFAAGTQPDNDVDMIQLFVPDGFVDTGLRGRWEGNSAIEEQLERLSANYSVGFLMGFTQVGDRLVFNWVMFDRSGHTSQGVEAIFDDGSIQSIDVTSLAVPYCIGGVETGCKDYETGEVHAQESAGTIPFCYLNAPLPCRMPGSSQR